MTAPRVTEEEVKGELHFLRVSDRYMSQKDRARIANLLLALGSERTALEAKLAEARREFANECWAKISEIQATEYGRTGYHAIVVAFRQWLKDNGAVPQGAQIHAKDAVAEKEGA